MIPPARACIRSTTLVVVLNLGVVFLTPVALAQEVSGGGAAPPPGDGGAGQGTSQGTEQGSSQGVAQGSDQGGAQGGPTLAELGVTPDENGNYDTSVLGDNDPRQGAKQGSSQGTTNGSTTVAADNSNTGAGSTNKAAAGVTQSADTSVANTSATTNTANGSAASGQNTANESTGNARVTSGSASVGVQQVTADNLSTGGSYGEISHTSSSGSHEGDYVLGLTPASTGDDLTDSFRSVNTVTGSASDNTVDIDHTREALLEVQNDGAIDNTLTASAISGQNEAIQNTGNASIETGNANVAATLLNFLNVNVVDGALWLEVADIFGDLNGNIVIPEEAIAYLTRRKRELLVSADNSNTGAGSTNTLDIDVTNTEETTLVNTADVENDVSIDAITGQNTATQNTGGSMITTGDVEATANTVTLANMNVVDGNLGVVLVNAFNRFLAFLLGSDGSWTPIGHEYASTLIEAENSQTGSDSTNEVDVDVTNTEETTIGNTARVRNDVDLAAITGQNTATQNTGNAAITTGDARAIANVVNVVNTNVIRGSLFVAVVNIFGNWFGDFLFGGQSLSALAAGSGDGGGVTVNAENRETGAGSTNEIDVDANSDRTLDVGNAAEIANTLTVDADTGHNEADRNTGLAQIDTGDVLAALHARNIANATLASIASPWANITADLLNSTTGADSTNTIDVTVNDEHHVSVLNDAAVDTAIGAVANTGFNTANRNTLGGMVTTGIAKVDAFIENLLNQTWLVGYASGDDPAYGQASAGTPGYRGIRIAAANERTGSGSTNANTVTPDISAEVDITNTADVNNDADVDVNTGFNTANRNTGGGAVQSGAGGINGGIDNTANQSDVAGGTGGSLDLDIDSDATVANTFTASATTGGNEANKNTGKLPSAAPPPPNGVGGAPPKEKGKAPEGVGGEPGGGEGRVLGAEQEEEAARQPARPKIAAIGPVAPAAVKGARPSRFPTAGADGWLPNFLEPVWWPLLALLGLASAWMVRRGGRRFSVVPTSDVGK